MRLKDRSNRMASQLSDKAPCSRLTKQLEGSMTCDQRENKHLDTMKTSRLTSNTYSVLLTRVHQNPLKILRTEVE